MKDGGCSDRNFKIQKAIILNNPEYNNYKISSKIFKKCNKYNKNEAFSLDEPQRKKKTKRSQSVSAETIVSRLQ